MKKLIYIGFIFVLLFASICLHAEALFEDDGIFRNSDEYKKIIDNKEHIVRVVRIAYPEGGYTNEDCDIEKAYKKILKYKRVKKSDIGVLDADSRYIFEFDDNTSVVVYFEGQFLHYKNRNYEAIEDKNGKDIKK